MQLVVVTLLQMCRDQAAHLAALNESSALTINLLLLLSAHLAAVCFTFCFV